MKRIVAGLIVALLLAVTSVAAACDLSCAFGVADSDCHASAESSQFAMDPAAMSMSGMDMAGMAMPEIATDLGQPPSSNISRAKAAHPTVGDMGPCERQSCEKNTFVATKAGRSSVAQVSAVQAVSDGHAFDGIPQLLHGACDKPARIELPSANRLPRVLRV